MTGTPPECPSTLIDGGGLVDVTRVRSKAVPGQPRDGEYLFYGNFRWSSVGQPFPDDVAVTAPFDGYVTSAWQYLNKGQYMFGLNLVHPCGLVLYLSKMRAAGQEIQSLVLDKLPEAREKDSRGITFEPGIPVKKGTVIATSVGVSPPAPQDLIGAQLDVGIVDMRSRTPQIGDDFDFATWTNASKETVLYGRCAWDYLSAGDRAIVAGLPLTGGTLESDTCTSP